MEWAVTAAGVLIVLAALRDVFHTLWYPSGRGRISTAVAALVWRTFQRLPLGPRLGALSGPLTMVVVVGTWAGLVLVGFALIYWPHLPEEFSYAPGLLPGRRGGFLDAFYLSLVTLCTLGFGDIVPTADWLRLVTPLEGLFGFGLLTAAVTWVLQVYPALRRRRALAHRLTLLHRSDTAAVLPELNVVVAAQLLDGLASDVTGALLDLSQYEVTYYFLETDEDTALYASVHYALRLAEQGGGDQRPDVRLAAAQLSGALADLARLIDREFLKVGGDPATVLGSYARDRARVPGRRPGGR
ncbi:potassium channel family protein [Prauserella muralis]|uniref:Potassium channel domain-containing protein n=1 Tax=Prauserella muralis TaxID=588067 RepID=A0A2V4APX7_9PSEU|nr:potassium channel family protein [Prauserella muralis]PXY22652.1 hypothetical protein BAY60_22805 [Prauserella muralis]TWE28363.1 ion channel [Prauserella muralis]